MSGQKAPVIFGIDLAGSPRRPTGLCVLRGLRARTCIAYGDEEILRAVQEVNPGLIPIDAPLTLPAGRTTIHDRSGEHLRPCDRELLRRGIRFFPITLGPMRLLTERGMALQARMAAMGFRVVECYPGAAQDIWGMPRQRQDRKGLLAGLRTLGVRGLTGAMTGDELDAVTAALTGRWFLSGRAEMLGGDVGILVPKAGG
jgi:predicted nuclease with RNAse H fold